MLVSNTVVGNCQLEWDIPPNIFKFSIPRVQHLFDIRRNHFSPGRSYMRMGVGGQRTNICKLTSPYVPDTP